MKIVKWLAGILLVFLLLVAGGAAALVYLVDWNEFKDTIQNQVKQQTGRELTITGDLNPSVFPWAGISIGELSLANAEGFGEQPFARIASADFKVKLLPLIRREVNLRTVQLNGLQLDLQRGADGTTNWDDLLGSTATTSKTQDGDDDVEVVTEVEGSTATIAALAVGGIEITDANVNWTDASTGTNASLSGFNLTTGVIELEKPFELNVDFSVVSDSLQLAAQVEGGGELMINLDQQIYAINGFALDAQATGDALPNGQLQARIAADVLARLRENAIDVPALSLSALGVELKGTVDVTELNAEPLVTASVSSNQFSPRDLLAELGMGELQTADDQVLQSASLAASLTATPASATLSDLVITLDASELSGQASLPTLDSAIPPVRFDLALNDINLDRYLPPAETTESESDTADESTPTTTGDEPIELPIDLLRALDVEGQLSIGKLTVSNLSTTDIQIPVRASAGELGVPGLQAQLYDGELGASAGLDVTSEVPRYSAKAALTGIQAEPLLADLMQGKAFLSGQGEVAADLATTGASLNALKAGLNGTFNTAFTDGSINGINIGYQLRRAGAALRGESLAEEPEQVKTDFSSLSVSGQAVNGVVESNDLDMRSPLLRLGGAGRVDLPAEAVDYTLTSLITGTAQGQGGAELEALKGVRLEIPVRGTFSELAENFAGVILAGMRDNIAANLENQARALAEQEAEALKAQAQEKADALREEAEAAAAAKKEELQEQAEQLKDEAVDKAKDALRGLLK